MTRRIKISFLVLVWGIVLIQIFVNRQEKSRRQEQTVTAFSAVEEQTEQITIHGFGYFGTMEIPEDTEEKMLVNLAKKFGITDGYKMQGERGEDYRQKVLIKEGRYATTTLQLLSMTVEEDEPEQYILMEIKTKEKMEDAYPLYQKMQRIYDEIGIDGQVSMETVMERDGDLEENAREQITDDLFERLHAVEVNAIMENGICTVYGYTRKEPSYLTLNGEKVNIQVTLSYDENADKTYVKIGIPIVNSVY